MGDLIPLEDPTDYRRVLQRIKSLWHEGAVLILDHAKERMQRRGIDTLDLHHLIRYGRVTEHSRPAERWRYRVDGTTVDGVRAACVVEIDGRLVIITVIAPWPRRRYRRKGGTS